MSPAFDIAMNSEGLITLPSLEGDGSTHSLKHGRAGEGVVNSNSGRVSRYSNGCVEEEIGYNQEEHVER